MMIGDHRKLEWKWGGKCGPQWTGSKRHRDLACTPAVSVMGRIHIDVGLSDRFLVLAWNELPYHCERDERTRKGGRDMCAREELGVSALMIMVDNPRCFNVDSSWSR
jgi:hypothetical protein